MSNEVFSVTREFLEQAWSALDDDGRHKVDALLAQPAAQHQGEPVALPSCKAKLNVSHDWDQGYSDGWKTCLEEIAKLGPLYTHADTGEVERLREELKLRSSERDKFLGWCRDARGEAVTLSAQLADMTDTARSLTITIHSNLGNTELDEACQRDLAALSASAESIAPKCKTCGDLGVVRGISGQHPNAKDAGQADCPECRPSAPDSREELVPAALMLRRAGFGSLADAVDEARAALEKKS